MICSLISGRLITGRGEHQDVRRGGAGVFVQLAVFLAILDANLALAGLPPGVQVRFVGENRSQLALGEAAHRQSQVLFPTLDGSNLFLEIGGDLLPGVQAVVGWPVLHGHSWLRAAPTHVPFLPGTALRSAGKNTLLSRFESNFRWRSFDQAISSSCCSLP